MTYPYEVFPTCASLVDDASLSRILNPTASRISFSILFLRASDPSGLIADGETSLVAVVVVVVGSMVDNRGDSILVVLIGSTR